MTTYTEIPKPDLPGITWDDPESRWDEEDLSWDSSGYTDVDRAVNGTFFSASRHPFQESQPFLTGEYQEITKPT